MYTPKAFEESRTEVLHQLMRERPFGSLVLMTQSGLEVVHLPLLLDSSAEPHGVLRGHLARANDIWQRAASDVEAVALFHGPHGYISPSWYASKEESHKVVPTWNYVVVHAYGFVRLTQDREWLRRHVTELTQFHEASRAEPWHVTDAPNEYIERMLGGIVGFEMPITRLLGKWKLGQNRSPEDRASMAQGLEGEGTDEARELARLIRASLGK